MVATQIIFKTSMNFYEINKLSREIADRIEQMNADIAWLKKDTEKQFKKPLQQETSQPAAISKFQSQELTPEQIKEQFALRGEDFLNETIQEMGKQFPSQLYENQTQKLPAAPAPQTHEQILKMVKKGDSIDSILLRFQGVE
ncbi:hypothetical protein [Nostoc sp. DSM 114167]|jgi:PPE-repeat protein|uniref:hypothetical protein n=1 Tax=Nostoc sp. DSM 114167 TaxID=3439050 RepID=UPI004045ACF7